MRYLVGYEVASEVKHCIIETEDFNAEQMKLDIMEVEEKEVNLKSIVRMGGLNID